MTGPVERATIRPMLPADVEVAADAIIRADWGDRRSWFEFATTQPECRPIVAEVGGTLVGTGVGTVNGSVGWVGTIWVDLAHRGAGLGRALTQVVIDDLEAAGCRTLLLVATDQGLLLYERMGFEVQTRYRILEAPGLEAGDVPDSAIRPFVSADLDAAATDPRRAAPLAPRLDLGPVQPRDRLRWAAPTRRRTGFEVTRASGLPLSLDRDAPANQLAAEEMRRAFTGRTGPTSPGGQPSLVGQEQDVARAL